MNSKAHEISTNQLKAIEQITPQKTIMSLRLVEKITKLLDSKFTIPGTKIKFGLDPILGLIPVLGDAITYIISGLLIFTMYRHGASKRVVAKMLFNSSLDAVIGSVPVIGTIFDVWYKSNTRNLKLLQDYYFKRDRYKKRHPLADEKVDYTAIVFLVGLFVAILFISIYFFFDIEVTFGG